MGIGAYTTTILVVDHGWRDLWTIPRRGGRRGRRRTRLRRFRRRGSPARTSRSRRSRSRSRSSASLKRFPHFTGGNVGKNLPQLHSQLGVHTNPSIWFYVVAGSSRSSCSPLAFLHRARPLRPRAARRPRQRDRVDGERRLDGGGEDGGVRPLRLLLRRRRRAVRDRDHLREPGHVPDRPLDPAPRRDRARRRGLALRDGLRRALRRVHPDQLGAGAPRPLQQASTTSTRTRPDRGSSSTASCCCSCSTSPPRARPASAPRWLGRRLRRSALLFRIRASYSRGAVHPPGHSAQRRQTHEEERSCWSPQRSPSSAVVVVTAGATSSATPGVTAKTILLEGTFPLSGPGVGLRTDPRRHGRVLLVRRTPSGGVNGRKINFKYEDDGYNPANTVQLTHKFVEQDHAFALVGGLGTEPQHGGAPVPERQQGAAALRLDRRDDVRPRLRAVPVDDRLAARLRGRRVRSTASTSSRTCRRRSSASSTRTTTTATTTCAA